MIDLSENLTVFLITSGVDLNYEDCLDALNQQTVKFTLKIIKNISPMSAAFQKMLNQCETKFYIECDSDMILYPTAIETMYNSIQDETDSSVFKCFQLLDIHLNFKIYGIKIYKYNIFKNYPYNLKHPSSEMEQLERIQKDGYNINNDSNGCCIIEQCIGKHSPKWTNESIFERYYNLMEKFKIYRYRWLKDVPQMLFNIFKKNPNILNLYAIAGMLASINSNKIIKEEKNIRKKRFEYKRLEEFMKGPTQATIYMTDKCNFKCEWCYRQHNFIEHAPDITPKLTDYLLKKLPSIKGVCICGYGEPMSSPNLIPVINTLKYQNKSVGLITNGSFLLEKFHTLLGKHRPDYISISLNAHCKEEHQKITKIDIWDRVIKGIELVAKSEIPCYVSSVVTTENIVFVPQLLKLIKSIGVKNVHLHNLLPHFNDIENKDFWKLVLTKDYKQHIDQIKQLDNADIVKKYPTLIDKNGGNQTCQSPWDMIAIDGNGSISICNSVLPCNSAYGNIKDPVVWNNEYCQKFREDFVNQKHNMCAKCFRNWLWM